jgi:uncharacterized protein
VRAVLRAARPDVATELHGLLASAAIAAAAAAGFPTTLDVPVVDGVIRLPGVGVLAMPGASVARLSSSTRPGELVVRRDGGEPLVVTQSGVTANWRPVPTVEIDGVRLCFADVDAERLSARDRDAWATAVGNAWSSVRPAAPELAGAMDKMITTVIPPSPGPAANPQEVSDPVGVPAPDPWETAVLLVEHVARSIVAATHRACGLFDTHKTADGPLRSPEAVFAEAYALRTSLQLAEHVERSGEPVDDLWVADRQKQVYQRIDELARDGRLTELGRLVLNGMDDRVVDFSPAS